MKRRQSVGFLKPRTTLSRVTTRESDTWFDHVPHEVFLHVCSYLCFGDWHTLYRTVLQQSPGDVPRLGSEPLNTPLHVLPDKTRESCTAEGVRQLQQILFHNPVALKHIGYNYRVHHSVDEFVLSYTKNALNDPTYYTRLICSVPLCSRCRDTFGTNAYWTYSNDPLHLCFGCTHDFELTSRFDNAHRRDDSGWYWISASKLKELCHVPSATKASKFALDHGIRARSNINAMDDDDALYTSEKKEYYFYKDILSYLSRK